MALPSKYKITDNLVKWLASFYDEVSTAITALAKQNTVVDLTGASQDYALEVGETAKINITGASTNLRIATSDGVYEISGLFDSTTFAADQDIALQANNTTYAGEFLRVSMIGDVGIATDEYDTVEADDAHYTIAPSTRLRGFNSRLIIDGVFSNFQTVAQGQTAGNRRVRITNVWRNGSVAQTALGTLSIGEAATGVVYVTRRA